MARIGGRSTWIAVPAGILCAVVVGTLVYLSLPAVPMTGAWVLATAERAVTNLTTPQTAAAGDGRTGADATDCRDLYPDNLWAELTWKPDVLLRQDTTPPATSVTTLVEALAPTVRLTCAWTFGETGTIASTLATVAPDASALAEAALRGQGFECSVTDGVVRCVREQAGVVEEHVVHGELWLSSVETGWHPEDYGDRLAGNVWR